MAFYLNIRDIDGNEIKEIGFSHGVLAYWEEKGYEYHLSIIGDMYEVAFSEGFSAEDQSLLDLKKEAEELRKILEREGHERIIEQNSTSNLVALDRFIEALTQTIKINGYIHIC